MTNEKITITKDTMMGELLNNYPECEPLIKKYFNGACFGCPSLQLETLEMAANMHGKNVDEIITDIVKTIG